MSTQRFFIASVLILLCLGLIACSDFATKVRKVTYPPEFNYVSQEQLNSSMHKLAYQLQQLEQALGNDMAGQPADQKVVVGILRDIERIAGQLQAGDGGSNHPYLEDYMSEFAFTVGEARLAAQQNPPRYYQAGRVSGACSNCHRVNR